MACWTKEENEIFNAMREQKKSVAEIAVRLRKTRKSIEMKIEVLAMPAEKKERYVMLRRERMKRFREKNPTPPRIYTARGTQIVANRANADMLHERDRRLATTPRDLTAAFFGDPLPGYSALEKRV